MAIANKLIGLNSGLPFTLESSPFDSGGAGRLYGILEDKNRVAKVFAAPVPLDHELGRRLSAVRSKNIVSAYLAQVDDLLVLPDERDMLVGFVMVRVVGQTLFTVTNADERKLLKIVLSPVDRLKLAEQVARAFEALHALHIRLGDAHHRNLMGTFEKSGRIKSVVLLEPDTWLFEWRTNGRMERFISMARADFLPPEFQMTDLTRTPLTFASDRFALTLLISLALFDCTPQSFAGSTLTAEGRIRQGYEWLTPKLPPGATPPDRLPIDPAAVPDTVMSLLRRGLSSIPGDRPTASEFATALADWHQHEIDIAVAHRFLSALTRLFKSRALCDLRAAAVEAFFAALRRYYPDTAAKTNGWWISQSLKLCLLVVVFLGIVLWSNSNQPAIPASSNPSQQTKPNPAPQRVNWRWLIEPSDPE